MGEAINDKQTGEENIHPFELSVVEVGSEEFDQKRKLAVRDGEFIGMLKWKEVGPETSVVMIGASPCIHIIARDNTNGATVVGHLNEDYGRDFLAKESCSLDIRRQKILAIDSSTEAGIIQPQNPEDLKRIVDINQGVKGNLEIHLKYEAMLNRIQELNRVHGGNALTIYLFGQNYPFFYHEEPEDEKMVDVLKTIRDRLDIEASLSKRGITISQIKDYRTDSYDTCTDETALVPQDKKIYLHRFPRESI